MVKLAICGPGGAGKGLVSEILRDRCGFRYTHGTSYEAAKIVFEIWGSNHYEDVDKCWEDRRNHREVWCRIIMDHNSLDPTRMYREMLESQDILDGIRDDREQRECYRAGIVDLWVWVDRKGCVDPTIKYRPEDCDVILPNYGTIGQLFDRTVALGAALNSVR